MSWTQNFKRDPIGTIASWEVMRWPWIVIAALSCALVLVAHNVFQVWLYMKPCEQCVYIRYAFLVMALGGVFPIIAPKPFVTRLIAYVMGAYGAIYGIMCSVKLSNIHHAIHGDDPDALFGMQGCSTEPHYPFGLPLEKWAPDWFLPTGDCGYDNSDVPLDVVLSPLQESIINMYNDAGGWYLIPPMKFMSMAQCCLLAFSVALLLYVILCGSGLLARMRK